MISPASTAPEPIGIAVEGEPDTCSRRLHSRDERLEVLRNRRVRMVIRKVAVHVAEDWVGREAQHAHALEPEGAARSVARVQDELDVFRREIDPRGDAVEVEAARVDPRDLAGEARCVALSLDNLSQPLNLGPKKLSLAAHHLEAVFVTGVVASGDHDAAVRLQAVHGAIEERRGPDANVQHVNADRYEPFDERRVQAIRRKAAVAGDGDAKGLVGVGECRSPLRFFTQPKEPGSEAAADRHRELVGSIAFGNAPNVVLAEGSAWGP